MGVSGNLPESQEQKDFSRKKQTNKNSMYRGFRETTKHLVGSEVRVRVDESTASTPAARRTLSSLGRNLDFTLEVMRHN